MATIAGRTFLEERRPDLLSGTPRAHALDRWIFVLMAAWFIVIVLTGFIPDSLQSMAMIKAHQRPPFPFIASVHAVLMASFLLLLLAQTVLVATGRTGVHRRLGLVAIVLAPAMIIAGLVLAPTTYHSLLQAAHFGPPAGRQQMMWIAEALENVLLIQITLGTLFALFITIGLSARERDPGVHKRMMILAIAPMMTASFDRMTWLPTTNPVSFHASELWVLVGILPMLVWDLARNRRLHRAYWMFLPIYGAACLVINSLWDTPWWHATARHIMGV
jgi:hypothetical protein